jgi:hypothetical protein
VRVDGDDHSWRRDFVTRHLKILLHQTELLSLFGEEARPTWGSATLSRATPAGGTDQDASPTQVSLKATVPERATPIGT